MHDGKMHEPAEYIVYETCTPQQGSNAIHSPYFTHGPDKQRSFLLIEVDITDSPTLYVLLLQIIW